MPKVPVAPKVNPSEIANKHKRQEVYQKLKVAKQAEKQERREKRKRESDELGDEAPPKQIPRTLDNTREYDDTAVAPDDGEVMQDEAEDEFAGYFDGTKDPKIMLTTQRYPSGKIFSLIGELMTVFPNCFYYKRGVYELKRICKYAANKGFTHLVVLTEKNKEANGLIISHLAAGPTAAFRFSSGTLTEAIKGHGRKTEHIPELILNNFTSRLGRRVGRMLGSLFPHRPEFVGRQVATFHNQRDFIFFRHHRYIFKEDGSRARLQELGPRFTLKLKYLLAGTFDTAAGEYEWLHKRSTMDVNRRTFHM